MDKTAIQLIQDTAVIAHAEPAQDIAIIPAAAAVHDLEKYNEGRRRFRGSMKTSVLSSFVAYAADATACFVETEAMRAKAYFNMGSREDPGHCDDSAEIRLEKTAAMTALSNIDGQHLTQKNLAEWMEDWHGSISAQTKDGADISLAKAIMAVRNITIEAAAKSEHKDDDFKGSRSTMESIEAKSKDGLPASLSFSCTPYVGLDERSFTLRLSVLTGDNKPALKLRIVGMEVHQEEMATEFQKAIKYELNHMAIYLGTFSP